MNQNQTEEARMEMKEMVKLGIGIDNPGMPNQRTVILDENRVRMNIRTIAKLSALGDPQQQTFTRWLIWDIAQNLGIRPASIHNLYMANGAGLIAKPFTTPAMNLRGMPYESALGVFRAAQAVNAGAFIFEIARSEIGYTAQRPAEYVATILAAAIASEHRGPVFIQGDHFQFSPAAYAKDSHAEIYNVMQLVTEAIQAGMYNIDIDASTLVDLSLGNMKAQQELNGALTGLFTQTIRGLQENGITVSVGGEIGEVGGRNSVPEELHAFMYNYQNNILRNQVGMSKISIQTGTSHGGIILPDGTLQDVAVDFEALGLLSRIAQRSYGLGGAVQHGASTLPLTAFRKFVEAGAIEVHLATHFQNMLFETIPPRLRQQMYAWLKSTKGDQRKAGQTDEQFLYNVRKHALGQFKLKLWNMPIEVRLAMTGRMEGAATNMFNELSIGDTAELVQMCMPPENFRPMSDFKPYEAKPIDVSGLSD